MASPPSIPLRSSSKRPAVQMPVELEDQRDRINDSIQEARKKLKANKVGDSHFWLQRKAIEQLLQSRAELHRKISLRDFQRETGGDEEAWTKTEIARDLFERMKTLEFHEEYCSRQAERLASDSKDKMKTIRNAFCKLFETSMLGLGLKMGAGKREGDVQTQFRHALIEASGAKHPNPKQKALWCPITSQYLSPGSVTAAHIFAYKHGQDVMDAIFGHQDVPELFSPHNGILMAEEAEKLMDKGLIVIVPDVPNHATTAEIKLWGNSEPKEYKIRVVDAQAPGMDLYVDINCETTWADLDGKRVQFKSSHRPRARYLYFLYCSVVLRRSWSTTKASEVLRDQFGQRYWGTVGSFMRKNLLLGFVERMGHDYEDLLIGAMEETSEASEAEVDDIAVVAAHNQIIHSLDANRFGREIDEEEDEVSDEGDSDEWEPTKFVATTICSNANTSTERIMQRGNTHQRHRQ